MQYCCIHCQFWEIKVKAREIFWTQFNFTDVMDQGGSAALGYYLVCQKAAMEFTFNCYITFHPIIEISENVKYSL